MKTLDKTLDSLCSTAVNIYELEGYKHQKDSCGPRREGIKKNMNIC